MDNLVRRDKAHPLDRGMETGNDFGTLGVVAPSVGKAPRCLDDELSIKALAFRRFVDRGLYAQLELLG